MGAERIGSISGRDRIPRDDLAGSESCLEAAEVRPHALPIASVVFKANEGPHSLDEVSAEQARRQSDERLSGEVIISRSPARPRSLHGL